METNITPGDTFSIDYTPELIPMDKNFPARLWRKDAEEYNKFAIQQKKYLSKEKFVCSSFTKDNSGILAYNKNDADKKPVYCFHDFSILKKVGSND
jgi:hypothetical protein